MGSSLKSGATLCRAQEWVVLLGHGQLEVRPGEGQDARRHGYLGSSAELRLDAAQHNVDACRIDHQVAQLAEEMLGVDV